MGEEKPVEFKDVEVQELDGLIDLEKNHTPDSLLLSSFKQNDLSTSIQILQERVEKE